MIEVKNKVESLTDQEIKQLCDWISDSKELPNISSNKESVLAQEQLMGWLEESVAYAIVRERDSIIGFCTLTRAEEKNLKLNTIEICHLIVHPDYRKIYNGSGMLLALIDEAEYKNYENIVGRVVKGNTAGEGLMMHLNWEPITNISRDERVNWYQYSFSKTKFKDILFDRMNVLGLTYKSLANLTGLSKQYINSLKNPIKGKPVKLPYWRRVRILSLILSQQNNRILDEYFKFLENQQKKYENSINNGDSNFLKESVKQWSKKWTIKQYLINIKKDKSLNSLISNAKPEIVYEILTSLSNLEEFKSKIVYADNTLTKGEIQKRITEINNSSIMEASDDWEIWTISDVFGEQSHKPSIEEVAKNILNYKIKYKYFTSINDDLNWQYALKNIKQKASELFDENKEFYSSNWNQIDGEKIDESKLSFDNYIAFYGIPDSMLFFRVRIYNALSQGANGNINLGGATRSDVLFLDINKDITNKITEFIPKIFVQEALLDKNPEINSFDDFIINIKSENITVTKKYPK